MDFKLEPRRLAASLTYATFLKAEIHYLICSNLNANLLRSQPNALGQLPRKHECISALGHSPHPFWRKPPSAV